MLDTASSAAAARQHPPLRRPGPRILVRAAVIAALLLFVLLALPQLLSLYYIDTMTQVAVYCVVALGLGVLVGRVGLVSLGQAAVLAIGAWVAARLLFATTQPYPLVLLEAGLVTMAAGTLIGLPALRLRGLYLALITLMLAGAITVVLATTNFPNGGHGFLGYNGAAVHIPAIRRPSIAASDPAYFRYSVVVAALMFLLVFAHIRTRPGRAWAAIRQSEPAALAAGINTTLYKLWAFALASFVTGVAGGVLAASIATSLAVRATFGYSFTTWRLHLRGESIRGALDVGWLRDLTVGRLMARSPPTTPEETSISAFRQAYPLGSAHFVVAVDSAGHYRGLVQVA